MSAARKLIEQGRGPDDVPPKSALRGMDQKLEVRVILHFDEFINEQDVQDIVNRIGSALVHDVDAGPGLAPENTYTTRLEIISVSLKPGATFRKRWL